LPDAHDVDLPVRDSGTLSGTSPWRSAMTATVTALRGRDTTILQAAVARTDSQAR
jgi:hypothetical protein